MLAVFLVYTSIAGGTPQLRPSELNGRTGEVALVGKVVGRVTGDARGNGLRFRLRDVEGTSAVPVVYRGSVPDMFRTGRDRVHGQPEADDERCAPEVRHYDFFSATYFDGHFVLRVLGVPTKVPVCSRPLRTTSRPDLKRSGTEPR